MEQYKFFAECILPEHMLDWFDLVKIVIIGEGDDKLYHSSHCKWERKLMK